MKVEIQIYKKGMYNMLRGSSTKRCFVLDDDGVDKEYINGTIHSPVLEPFRFVVSKTELMKLLLVLLGKVENVNNDNSRIRFIVDDS